MKTIHIFLFISTFFLSWVAGASESNVCLSLLPTISSVDELRNTQEAPYIRYHFRNDSTDLATPLKVAVLGSGQYAKAIEEPLVNEGYFAVAIRNPSLEEINHLGEFTMAPEAIRWVMHAPESVESWIANIGSSSARNQLKRKIKASSLPGDEVRAEYATLNLEDYNTWYNQFYIKEILTKEGALPAWEPVEKFADRFKVNMDDGNLKNSVPGFTRIFYYSKDNTLLGGALISTDQVEKSLSVRAAAFEESARAKYELAIRGMVVLIEEAKKQNLKILSYGTDTNLYGVDTTMGLAQFKASLGMVPLPAGAGKWQLIKILNGGHKLLGSEKQGDRYQGVFIYAAASNSSKRASSFESLQTIIDSPMILEEKMSLVRKHMEAQQLGSSEKAPDVKVAPGVPFKRTFY